MKWKRISKKEAEILVALGADVYGRFCRDVRSWEDAMDVGEMPWRVSSPLHLEAVRSMDEGDLFFWVKDES